MPPIDFGFLNLALTNIIALIKKLRELFPDSNLLTDAKMSEIATAKWQDIKDKADAWQAAHPAP